ncbi:MAG: HAD family phosphatase [Pseudomonadota bacterium]
MIEAVVFDIGNVLIEWRPEPYFDQVLGEERRRDLFAAVDLLGMNERIDLGEDFVATVNETAERFPDYATEIRLWRDAWMEFTGPVIDGSVEALRDLRAKGVPVFALSNFGIQTLEIAEEAYPFLTEFDRRYISGHMRVMKPDPEIYRRVEADSGVAAERLLFVDDLPKNIAAAEARGWQGHLFEGAEGWRARLVAEGLL